MMHRFRFFERSGLNCGILGQKEESGSPGRKTAFQSSYVLHKYLADSDGSIWKNSKRI